MLRSTVLRGKALEVPERFESRDGILSVFSIHSEVGVPYANPHDLAR
jgi:hypothetical protein